MKKILGIGNALVDIITFLENDAVLKSFSLPKGSMQLIEHKTALSVEEATQAEKSTWRQGDLRPIPFTDWPDWGLIPALSEQCRDALGIFFREDMIGRGISPHLTNSKTSTGSSQAMVTPGGERTMATFLGAAVELSLRQLNPPLFRDNQHLHLEGYLVPNQTWWKLPSRWQNSAG